MRRRLPAYKIYWIVQGTFWLFFAMMSTLGAVYRIQSAGLTAFQLVIVGTVLEFTVFVFEVPTGIVADLVSRRQSVIIGYLLIGIGFMVEASVPIFGPILLAQLIWGIGATFTSGAEEAWLADEEGEENLAHIYLRGAQFAQIGMLAGILASVIMGRVALNVPIFIGGLGIVLIAMFLFLFMPETNFRPAEPPDRSSWRKMGRTFREGWAIVRMDQILPIMMIVALFYGLSSEGLDRLWEAHLLTNFTFPASSLMEPVMWFGLINAGEMLLVILASELIRRYIQVEQQQVAVRLLMVMNSFVVVGLIAFGLAPTFLLALGSLWTVFLFKGAGAPIFSAWMNKGLKPSVRATVLSMRGQVDAIGQIIGGPIIGLVAGLFGLNIAMVAVGLLLSPTIFLFGQAQKLLRKSTPKERAIVTTAESD